MGHQRDLTDTEMEKLVQLQDLTGIDDLQICRALLGKSVFDLILPIFVSENSKYLSFLQRAKIGIWRRPQESI